MTCTIRFSGMYMKTNMSCQDSPKSVHSVGMRPITCGYGERFHKIK